MDELYYIYRKDGSKIKIGGTDTEPIYLSIRQLQYDGTFLGQSHISITIKSPIAIPFEGQEYTIIDDEKYTLKYIPSFEKQARSKEYSEAFVYDNIIMQAQIDDTTRVEFLDYVLEDNIIHYSSMPTVYFYGTVKDLAMRIQANLDRVFTGDNKWTVVLPTDLTTLPSVEKQITYQNKKTWDAITDIWNQYKVMFYSKGRNLYVGYSRDAVAHNFKYGIGNGLKSLKRNTDENNAIITRIHVYGSKTNLPYRYYNTLGTTVKANLPISFTSSDGVNRYLWFKVKDAPIDMFKESTDFSFTGTGPTNPTDPQVDVPVTKTVTFTATKKAVNTYEGVALFIDCTSLGWTYADYRWLYWAMQKSDASVTITSSVVVSYIPTKYLNNANVYASESMYLPNLMLPAIRINDNAIKYYDASFNEITDSTKAYYKMVKSGNNTKGLDIYLESIKGVSEYGILEGNITFDNNSDSNIVDLVDDENGIYPTLTKLTTTDGDAACKVVSATQLTDDGVLNSSGTVDVQTFQVVVKTGFNPNDYVISGETAQISFKSGMCQGRSFDFNCSNNNDGTYTLTCNRIIDGDFAYPNSVYQIKADDTFVLLGIELPDVYIQSAEQRLLIAGLKYLAKFDHTKNTYTPKLDNIFLNANKDIRKDILVGSLFQFTDNEINGVDANNNGILITLPISQLTIKIGYSMIREYSITLADSLDLSADAVQRTINAVQGYFTNNSGGVAFNQVGNLAFAALKDRFLSRLKDDIAKGVITFAKGLIAKLKSTFEQGAQFGAIYREGLNGEGANIDGEGNAEFQTVNVRGSLTASELDFNRIKIIEGQEMSSRAAGTILSVRKTQDGDKIIKLKLAGDEFGAFKVGDMFRGMYNTLGIAGTTQYKPVDADGNSGDKLVDGAKDKNGFPMRKGFYTAYAMVTSILTDNVWDEAEQCRVFEFTYQNMDGWKDADGIEIEPCAMMKIAQYSNAEDETRQGFMLRNTIGKVYNILYYHCTTWQIHSWNVLKAEGQIKGMEFFVGGDTTQTVTLDNDGTYEAGSHYFNGELKTIDPTTWDDILSKLQNYDIRLSKTADTITVDAVGNVIGGYWTSVTGDDGTVRKAYRLNTAVTAYKADGTALLLNGAFTDDTALVTKGQYAVYATGSDCTPLVVDGVVYITAINNIHDGDAKTTDNIDFAVMRAMKECVVTITVDCEGIGVRSRDYRVVINHDDAAFVTADLSNEMISVAWNTKTSKFIGLPATTEVRMWHGNEKLTVDSVNVVTDLQSVVDITNNAGVLTISETQDGSTALKDTNLIELTATATYAGISYEQTLYLKITKSADGNTYELMPTSTVINAVNKDGSYVFDNSGKVACGVKCTSTTDGVYDMNAAMLTQRGLTMWYSLQTDNNGDAVDDRTYTAYTLGALIDVTSADEISFEIKSGDTIVDKETIPIVKGGKNGADGANGTDAAVLEISNNQIIVNTNTSGAYSGDAVELPHFRVRIGGSYAAFDSIQVGSGKLTTAQTGAVTGGSNGFVLYFGSDKTDAYLQLNNWASGKTITAEALSVVGIVTVDGTVVTLNGTINVILNKQGKDGTNGDDGTNGADGMTLVATPRILEFDTDTDGKAVLSNNTSTITVLQGTNTLTPTLAIVTNNNCTATASGNVITISAIASQSITAQLADGTSVTKDNVSMGSGYVDYTATADGVTLSGRLLFQVSIKVLWHSFLAGSLNFTSLYAKLYGSDGTGGEMSKIYQDFANINLTVSQHKDFRNIIPFALLNAYHGNLNRTIYLENGKYYVASGCNVGIKYSSTSGWYIPTLGKPFTWSKPTGEYLMQIGVSGDTDYTTTPIAWAQIEEVASLTDTATAFTRNKTDYTTEVKNLFAKPLAVSAEFMADGNNGDKSDYSTSELFGRVQHVNGTGSNVCLKVIPDAVTVDEEVTLFVIAKSKGGTSWAFGWYDVRDTIDKWACLSTSNAKTIELGDDWYIYYKNILSTTDLNTAAAEGNFGLNTVVGNWDIASFGLVYGGVPPFEPIVGDLNGANDRETGIYIKDRLIKAKTDKFVIVNRSNETTFSVDSEGNIVGAGNASFKGNLSAATGTFAGLLLKKKTTVTDATLTKYVRYESVWGGYILDIGTGVNWYDFQLTQVLEIHAPAFDYHLTSLTTQQKDYARQYVGNVITIYNNGTEAIAMNGYFVPFSSYVDGSNSTISFSLAAGQYTSIECVCGTINSKEAIFWVVKSLGTI